MWKRNSIWVISSAAAILLVPPAFVWARQMAQVFRAQPEYGRAFVSSELLAAFEQRQGSDSPSTFSHPHAYPYLECDVDALPRDGREDVLVMAFMAERRMRERYAYRQILRREYATPAMAALTACIEASVLASICADRIGSTIYGQVSKLDKLLTGRFADQPRAAAFCGAIKGLRSGRDV